MPLIVKSAQPRYHRDLLVFFGKPGPASPSSNSINRLDSDSEAFSYLSTIGFVID